MERTEIENYLTDQFWHSSEVFAFADAQPTLEQGILPKGSIIFQTSGSSGSKKWVVHTRETLLESAKLVTQHLQLLASDNWFLALPIHHVGGFGVLARSYYSGCKVTHYQGKWNALKAISMMMKEQVSLCSFVPTQVVDLVNEGLECPPSVRAVIIGGGKLDEALKIKAIALGWQLLESYGMTETGSQIATQLNSSDKGLSVISGWDTRLNAEGLLELKGKALMKGYIIDRGDQSEFIQPFDKDGWFQTSDKVEILEDSKMIKFLSRNDRTVKILGELVNLSELEYDLQKRTHTEILIVELLDERRGYSLYPIIERSSYRNLDLAQLKVSGLHRLESLSICDSFPRNSMGKLDRSKLRELVVLSE